MALAMRRWFRPKCPIGPVEKDWIEERMAWLTRQFGLERLKDVRVILPTAEFFPERYEGRHQDVRVLLRRVCRYMDVDPDPIQLEFHAAQGPPPYAALLGHYRVSGAAGTYERDYVPRISISEGILDDPHTVVATIAHELGHVHLLGDGRLTGDEIDHEPLTDLLTVFLGMGLFTANSRIREKHWTTPGGFGSS